MIVVVVYLSLGLPSLLLFRLFIFSHHELFSHHQRVVLAIEVAFALRERASREHDALLEVVRQHT